MATRRLNFSIDIQAAPETIWRVLWTDETYRKWTRVFNEGSYAVSDWQQGSRVHFLSGEGDGLFSEVARVIPNELMSIRHLGALKDGVEQPDNEETKSWSGAMEIYRLTRQASITRLDVELDTTEGAADYFTKTFPLALEEVKKMAEG